MGIKAIEGSTVEEVLPHGVESAIHRATSNIYRIYSMVKTTPAETAILGIACRVAGANSPSKLWENILNKTDLQQTIPSERFNIDGFFHPNGPNKGTVRCQYPRDLRY